MDPLQQMELEEKRRVVDADKEHQKAKEKLGDAVEKEMPVAAKGGQVMPLVLHPSPLLHRACEPVETFDRDLRNHMQNMAYTMYMCGGVGVAGPQVSDLRQIFVADWSGIKGEGGKLVTVVNPEVLEVSPEKVRLQEGCLSFPSVRVVAERPAAIQVRFWTDHGEKIDGIWLEGWAARIFLHEYDHLKGVVFTEQVSRLERQRALKKAVKLQRNVDKDMDGPPRRKQRRGWR
jgi:peptide deformylase